MGRRSLKILLLFDLSVPIAPEEYAQYLTSDDWKTEANILNTLKKLGHVVKPLGIHDDIDPFMREVTTNRPDLIFNLSEAFNGDRSFEPHMVALFELLNIKYTGCGPYPLRISKDKGMAKKVLSYHKVNIPKFEIAKRGTSLKGLKEFTYPTFVKPLELEASEGISQVSLCETEKETVDRVKFIHERLECDAIVEEYIEGRELYVGVLGNERLTVFPPRELFFKQVPEGEPKFATFKAKWDENYRKKWGIDTGPARALSPETEAQMIEVCKTAYKALQLKCYGRIDLRVRPNGEVVFIEANPNPSIAKGDDFALSAAKADLDYESLIAKIISLAMAD